MGWFNHQLGWDLLFIHIFPIFIQPTQNNTQLTNIAMEHGAFGDAFQIETGIIPLPSFILAYQRVDDFSLTQQATWTWTTPKISSNLINLNTIHLISLRIDTPPEKVVGLMVPILIPHNSGLVRVFLPKSLGHLWSDPFRGFGENAWQQRCSKVFGSRRVCAFQRAFPRSFDPLPELPKAGTCKVRASGFFSAGFEPTVRGEIRNKRTFFWE